jgi:hypothetical protein
LVQRVVHQALALYFLPLVAQPIPAAQVVLAAQALRQALCVAHLRLPEAQAVQHHKGYVEAGVVAHHMELVALVALHPVVQMLLQVEEVGAALEGNVIKTHNPEGVDCLLAVQRLVALTTVEGAGLLGLVERLAQPLLVAMVAQDHLLVDVQGLTLLAQYFPQKMVLGKVRF